MIAAHGATVNRPAASYMVRPAGIEPATFGFEVRRSIQLSYGRLNGNGVSEGNRTLNPWSHSPVL